MSVEDIGSVEPVWSEARSLYSPGTVLRMTIATHSPHDMSTKKSHPGSIRSISAKIAGTSEGCTLHRNARGFARPAVGNGRRDHRLEHDKADDCGLAEPGQCRARHIARPRNDGRLGHDYCQGHRQQRQHLRAG